MSQLPMISDCVLSPHCSGGSSPAICVYASSAVARQSWLLDVSHPSYKALSQRCFRMGHLVMGALPHPQVQNPCAMSFHWQGEYQDQNSESLTNPREVRSEVSGHAGAMVAVQGLDHAL